ncbi:MAG TPA: cytochrome o ubiquinol oxidase subunit IV [Candidatus Saccharimonadales bacterium]|nr:cytochrome o ubiquinol oxidase subunit IV [Candidatus Saccharimonadales bacterium]
MSAKTSSVVSHHNAEHGSFRSYFTGYILSVVFTVTAYLLVVHHALSPRNIVILIVGLAMIQFIVQLIFFLHLGKESKPRWKLFVLIFMIGVISILVFGSLWIMNNLNYRQQYTPEQVNTYLNNQGGGF